MKCPISLQKHAELEPLIRKLCFSLKKVDSPIVSFIPRGTLIDIALFFAAWRMGKSVYPLSFRLPEKAIEERLQKTKAHLVEPKIGTSEYDCDEIDETKIATLIETSSGSKIACHTLEALLASAKETIKVLELEQNSSYCLNLPLFHISGIALMLRTLLSGAKLLLKEEWKEATHISMVPTQLWRLQKEKAILPKCKYILVGGAPFPANLKEVDYPIIETYGMTETASMIAVEGKVLPHLECEIREGEIFVRGRSLFAGYFGMAEREEWFATKDLGKFVEGRLEIVGRKDRQFVSGGENIQPEEIERALLEIEGIVEARVEGIADEEFGMVPIAAVRGERRKEEILEILREKLEKFKVPKKIDVTDKAFEGGKLAKLT